MLSICTPQVKSGIVMNVICIITLQFAMNTWGYAYFKLGEYPDWAGNITAGGIDISNFTTTPIMTIENTTLAFWMP